MFRETSRLEGGEGSESGLKHGAPKARLGEREGAGWEGTSVSQTRPGSETELGLRSAEVMRRGR